MPTAEKKRVVEDLQNRLGEAKCLYLTDFTGLDVEQVTDLRRQLTDARVDYLVVKNTLARRALEGGRYADLIDHLVGPNAFAFSLDDVVSPAKILADFAKKADRPRIKAGAIEGSILSLEEISRIAALPPRDALLAEVVGYARAPIAGLVYTLNGLLSQFVRTLDAVRSHREQAEPPVSETETEPPESEASAEPEAIVENEAERGESQIETADSAEPNSAEPDPDQQ